MSEQRHKDSDVPFELPKEEEEDVLSSIGEDASEPVITSSIEFPEGESWTTTSGGVATGSGPHAAAHRTEPSGRPAELGFQGPGIREAVTVTGPIFQIGRSHGDLVLDDRFLSPFHCQLRRMNDSYRIEDLGSINGVYLRIADELALEDRDEIITGSQRLIFRTTLDAPAGPSAPNASSVPILGAALPSNSARVITMLSGGLIAGIFPVRDGLRIGRENADITAPNDPDLSRHHAEIVRRDDGRYVIRDKKSTFGTFVRIHDPVELLDGDCFVIGRTRVSVRYPGSNQAT